MAFHGDTPYQRLILYRPYLWIYILSSLIDCLSTDSRRPGIDPFLRQELSNQQYSVGKTSLKNRLRDPAGCTGKHFLKPSAKIPPVFVGDT
jgi:hypothetical protein